MPVQNDLHYDCWGTFGVASSLSSTTKTCGLFTNGTANDIVYEIGSADLPVTQDLLDGWGKIPYWANVVGAGRLILVLYTEGGGELSVPAHEHAEGLVVVWRDSASRTWEAFDAKYDFATLFNTSTIADPRPDLSGDGVTLTYKLGPF